jgi:hypothetical protein
MGGAFEVGNTGTVGAVRGERGEGGCGAGRRVMAGGVERHGGVRVER